MFSFLKKHRGKFIVAFFALQAAVNYAQADIMPEKMNTLMNNIVATFTGPLVKGILIASLAGCAVAYGFNKDNEKMKRNIIAIAVACAILFAASEIIAKIIEAASSG
ncbi:MAG: TrbC/VirB2 family protein [Spirochaetaceae bacterium]|jgi:type IV secretory pathway VirB2 component (pilin)|nr:TrbC/VirB2 family protein [Spirochaetaceae bacterium]